MLSPLNSLSAIEDLVFHLPTFDFGTCDISDHLVVNIASASQGKLSELSPCSWHLSALGFLNVLGDFLLIFLFGTKFALSLNSVLTIVKIRIAEDISV